MKAVENLRIKIFADGADKAGMLDMNRNPWVKGLTTNPSLMHKAGIRDYKAFALDILSEIKEKPLSFEVFSDDFDEMERQAMEIAGWADNVYVKMPITNTRRQSGCPLFGKLASRGVKLNVTALLTLDQVRQVSTVLDAQVPAYVSVFAGRVADTGRDPIPLMAAAAEVLKPLAKTELLWASTRELLNIVQAEQAGCHVITVPNDILKRLTLMGYDLDAYSLDTVKTFYADAQAAGFRL